MRRLLTFVLAAFILVSVAAIAPSQQPAPQQQTQTKEQTVYIKKTGKKYHTATCRYLAKSKIPISDIGSQASRRGVGRAPSLNRLSAPDPAPSSTARKEHSAWRFLAC